MNYRELLRKYMDLVLTEEGITFLDRVDERTGLSSIGTFTPEELAELHEIEAKL